MGSSSTEFLSFENYTGHFVQPHSWQIGAFYFVFICYNRHKKTIYLKLIFSEPVPEVIALAQVSLSFRVWWSCSSVQFISVAQSCPALCDPMNCSMPGLPVHHQLPEFTQTHVHRVGDSIQPSHPLSSPSPPAPNPSRHQGLFK